MAEPKNEMVEMIITRACVYRAPGSTESGIVWPGDKIQAPTRQWSQDIPPVRWWEYTRKAALPEDVKRVTGELAAESVDTGARPKAEKAA